jgi:hypothetical protein
VLWRVVAVAAALGLACLLALLFRIVGCARGHALSPLAVFNVAVLAAYLVPFMLTDYFDRYLLFALPFLFVLHAKLWNAGSEPAIGQRMVAGAWIGVSIALSVAGTHDYFAWNRARWDAIRLAERLGATPASVDGGLEYNALHRDMHGFGGTTPGKSWWWVTDDAFVVAFSTPPGYESVETFPVRRWLARSPAEVKLSRRKP